MLDWQSHKKLRIFIRTICIVLIVTFVCYDLTWAGAGEVFSNKNKRTSQDSPSVDIPQELGVIKDSYTSKYNPHKLVIHIQDAHANVEAQENEAKLIKYLKDKYNVNLVSVEGGFGDFDAEFFRSFPKDKKVRDKIAKYFLSKAFISGSDYLLITENNPPAVYGAEDKELYTAHLNTFKDNQATSDSLSRSLSSLESVISALKDKYYSKDLKELDSKISDFRQGRISLEEYLSYLNITAIINNADLSKFPNLYSLITSQELEHKINFDQAETERQDLIDSLTKALSKADLEELVKTSLDFKANKITPVEYYSYLEKLTKEAGVQANTYNNLFTYIKYITLSQNLDNSKVFDEVDDFTQSLKEKLAVTNTQKDIDNLTYIIRIFKGLADINLSPKEYEHFRNTREEFNQRKLAQLFRRYIDSSYLKSLPSDAEIDSLEKFYSLAHDRDKAIVSNSLNRLNREYSTNAVIIVAGGFHTQGLTSILKEKDISYVVVAPSIKDSQEKENIYFALLKDKKLPLQDILNDPDTLQIINSISDPEARQLLVNYWVARASRYYSPKELQAQLDRLHLSNDDQKAVETALNELSPKETVLAKQEVLPASHEEQKPPNGGLTAGVEEQKKDNAPQPAAGNQQSFFRKFFMTFVLSFALFIFTGCASTFSARLGPVGIRSHTEVTLTQPKQHEPPVSVAGSIELGDKVNKQASAQPGRRQKTSEGVELNSQGKARLGPVTGELAPKLGITQVPQGEAPISLSGKVSLGETVKPQGVELATEAKVRLGPLNAGINPKVGLSDVPQGEKPFSLDGKISLDEVKPKPKQEQKEVILQVQAPAVQELTSQPAQADIQSAEQKALEARVKALEEISAQKEKALQDAQAKILQLQQEAKERLERIEAQNKQVQEKLSQVDSELAKANQQNTNAQEKIQKLTQEQDTAGAKIKVLDDKRQALESESAALKGRVKASEDSLNKAETRISSLEEYNKHWWYGLGTGWKIILSILGALGIGTAILRIGLYKSWQRLRQLRVEVAQKEEEKQRLDAQISAQKQTLNDLSNQVEQAKVTAVETEKKRSQEEQELQKAASELTKLKQESEKLQAELIRVTQEKNKAIEDLEKKETELKAAIAEKQAVLNSPQRDEVIKEKVSNVAVKKITDPEISKGVEFLRQSNTKSAQGLLRSQKIDLKERMRFVHDELGFDIANGQGRSLLSRNPDTLREQKVFLQNAGLPLTVSNLSSSKRSFSKKELKQIVKHPEWQELTNEEKLSVASHLYDIYGLRLSWLLRDNDWYQLLHYFNLPGEPINYTPRSIDFIQRYELSRFQKFANIPQTKYRLSKIKAVIELLDLKVIKLLNTVTTRQGFELYLVKPEVTEGKVEYEKQYYPLPKTPFVLEDLKVAGEVEEGTVEPDEALVTADLDGRVTALKQEITQKQEELARLDAEKQKKISEFDSQIRALTEQRDKLLKEIEELQRTIEAKREELSLAVTEQEEKVSALKTNITSLEKEQAGLEQAIRDLQKKLEESQVLIKSLEEQKNKASQELSALGDVAGARTQVEEVNRRLQEAQENQGQLEQTIAALTNKKQGLETELSAQEAQKKKLEADISALSGQAQGLEQRIADLNSQKAALAQKEKSLSDEIDAKAQKLRETEEQIADLGNKNTASDTQLADLKKQKKTLETEIAKLSQLISELSSDARKAKSQIDTIKASLAGLEEQRKSAAENLEALGNNRAALNTEITSLEAQRGQLNAELERLRQEFSGVKQDAAVRRGSLDKDITQRQQALNQLNSDISALDTQKKKLDQEIGEAQKRKQQESQDLDRLNREREEINQKIAQAKQQLEDVNAQIQGYSGTLDELKQRGVNLNQEIPALTRRKDALQEELTALEKSKQGLEAGIAQAKQDSQAVIAKSPPAVTLPKPYSLMIFDVDNTLTDVTTEINIDLLNQLLDFLSQNIRIALVTAQSMDEVNRYIVGLVKDKKHLLSGLTVYSSGGAKCFSFNAQGQAVNGSDYDATIGLTMTVKPKEVEDAIRKVVGSSAGIGFRDGLITITGLSNREKTFGELTTLFKEEGWHFVPRLAGGHTIHVLIGGVDKARAARHFVKELSPKALSQEIPYEQVLVIGDSFSAGGLDADLIAALPQADIVSVGKKPQGRQLRDLNAKGLLFSEDLVGGRNWQATFKILKEVRKGKSVRQIGKDNPHQSGGTFGRGLASFIFALTAGIFSVFPSEISNAQMSLPRGPQQVQVAPVDSRTEAKIKQLIEDLKKDDKREKAIKELTKIGIPAVKYLVEGAAVRQPRYSSLGFDVDKFRQTCEQVLGSFGEQAKDSYVVIAKDQDTDVYVRWVAIRKLGDFKDYKVVEVLYELLTTDKKGIDPQAVGLGWRGVLHEAALSLQKIGDGNAINALYRVIDNEDEKVRLAAGSALVEIGDKAIEGVTIYFTIFNYKDNIARIDRAIKLINDGRLNHPKTREALKWVIITAELPDNKFYPDTAQNAATAFLNLGHDGAITLGGMLRDKALIQKSGTFEKVLEAIVKAKPNYYGSSEIYDSLEWLVTDASTGEKTYSPYAVKLAVKTLTQLGKEGNERLLKSFSPENYLKSRIRSEALDAIAELKIKDPEVIKKLYWLAIEAVTDGGRYYTNISNAAGSALYQLEGDKAIKTLVAALKDSDWRKRDGAAEAILGIARSQGKNLSSEVIAALQEIRNLGTSHDYRQEVIKETESLLKQLTPDKVVFFSPERYRNYPQKMILDVNMFVAYQNTNFVDEMAKAVVYAEGDGSFNRDILKACVESLLKLGDKGQEALAGVINYNTYQQCPNNLKAVAEILAESKPSNSKLSAALISLAQQPDLVGGKYYPDLNKQAVQALINMGSAGNLVDILFFPDNYRSKPAQLQLIVDTIAETKTQAPKISEKLSWAFNYKNQDNSWNNSLRISLINAFVKLDMRSMTDSLVSALSDTNEETRKTAIQALIAFKVPQAQIESLINADNPLAKEAAREILKTIAPGRLEELTQPKATAVMPAVPQITDNKQTGVSGKLKQAGQSLAMAVSVADLRGKLFLQENYHQAAQGLRDYYQDKPWTEKIPNYLLSYIADAQIWILVGLGLAGLITGIVFYVRGQKVRAVYKQLASYVGQTTWSERRRLRKAAVQVAKKTHYDVDDVYKAIAEKLPEVYKLTQNKRIEKIAKFLDKLNQAKVNSGQVLRYGVPFMAQAAKDEKEFDKGLDILADTVREMQKNNISVDTIFGYSLSSISSYVTEFSVFEAACKLIKELSSRKQNPQEILTSVAPQALKTARDANTKVARLNIILHLLLESIHPTQLLIETLEKTTSQSNLTAQLTQWSRLMNDFKTGAVKFDINNPVYVDLEYTTYRQLASQLSQSNTYENYQSLIQQFRSQSGSPSGLAAQEQAEVKLAVYEAYRLLEFIVAVKSKADKIARPVWVIPNLSYGKFAVSPILDELGKLNIEVHYAKVGSTGAHEHPEYVVPALFTDDVYLRILRERPILVVVDGTQHLMPRPEEGKSSRYPDAYVGYRNMAVALNEVISERKEDKFLDKVHITKDFFGTLRQNSEYTSLVDTLEKLNAGLDQPMLFYKLGFWNPAGLPLVVREARKEVQKVTPLNPDDLDSPTLIFINSPLLDEDLPADIKQWAGLEQPHVPAYFDDKGQIQQTMFAVNGRGVYLSHSMEFETNRACQEIKDNYKGRLPQIVYQQPTPESVRSSYEAMLFDLDGTLTDTLSEIDKSLLNKLIYFLSSGVVIGIVTSQSLDEVKKYILDKVDSNNSAALKSLVVFTARGAQAWGFDQSKNPYPIYDRSQTDLNDQQRQLIRQLVNQALGSLAGDSDVTDRQGQITIRLKKNKDKRDLVNTTLGQLIANNNLPFQTEYSGNSTIHVVMRGIDKGTAKDYFISQLLPQRLNHQTDVSKLLIAGDRFQEGGSDRPMVVPGARVVSVGGKDKSVPAGVEVYPHHGWKGTNQLLGDIINKSGRTTVTLPSIIIGLFGLPNFWQGLNDAGQGLYDASKKPLLYFGIATLGLGFLFLSITSGIKYYKAYRIYKEIKQALNFLDGKDSRALFKAVSGYTTWKKIQHIDSYNLLVDILPVLSKQAQDKRLIEVANTAARLKKAKINPRHVFKYVLTPISSKTSDEKQFIKSLGIAERFALSFNDKRFDYHDLLRDAMPSLAKTTRSIDELNEAMLLGITLVNSGRNPTFALTNMLPEVAALTKSFSDFRLGVYALQQLCLEGFEPTKYLIHELIKQGTPQKIDQTISDWQEIRRKFKTGEVAFNPKNQLHANLEYTTFRELVDRTLKQTRKYSFAEYQQILGNFNNNHNQPHLRRTEKAEIKFAAYEAFRFRQFVLDVKRQADKMGKRVWVVPNLSYGRFAVSPIIKDLAADGVEVHYARIGSTESHDNALLIKPELFSAALYARIMNEQPVIIVVDGTQHLLARPKDRKSGRYPDAYVGYRNMVITVNDILTQAQEQFFKNLVKTDGSLIRHLRKKSDYRTLRRRLIRLYNPNIKTKRSLYALEFWNPGDLELALRRDRKEVTRARNVSPGSINQPTLIFVNSVMLDEDVPVFIRDWINRDKKVHHKPAYFDDTSHIQNIIFNVDSSGVSLSDEIYANIRKEYKRIKGIYRPSFNLPTQPLNLPKLPYKAVISDLDGTLSDTLEEVPKPVMEKLLYLLSLGVQVAIVTTQSYKEVEKYLLSQVPAKNKALLQNLTIYAATGSQGFGFDSNGDPLQAPLYDTSDVKLSDRQMDAWRGIIKAMLQEYALDKEVKDKKGNLVATPVKLIDAGSQVIIRLKERGFLRREIVKRLQIALNREQLPITLKEIGGTSIRMTIRGIDKSIAVDYHLTQVCKARFGFEPKPNEVLILGNSFDEDGDDRDMMISGARVFSVGHRPLLHHLRAGINFYPEHSWEGSEQVLAEFINAMSSKVEEAKKQIPQPTSVKLNSFAFLPFLAAGGFFDNLDSFSSFVLGCIVGIAATLLIFKDRIFGAKEKDEPQDYYNDQEPEQNIPTFDKRKPVIDKVRTRGFDTDWQFPILPRKHTDFNQAAKQIREEYPGLRIGIIGAADPARGYLPQTGIELGRKLRAYVGDKGFVFTGGVSGVGVDVYQGVVEASGGGEDRFFVLLPEGMFAGREYRDISPSKKVNTANFGEDMFERRIGMGKVADVVIILNGRNGTLHEAVSALESGRKVIALNYGGAGALLYHAKLNGIVPVLLSREGVKQEYLNNIIACDLSAIEKSLDSIAVISSSEKIKAAEETAKPEETKEVPQQQAELPLFDQSNAVIDNPAQLDYFGKYVFTTNKDGSVSLSPEAVSAINSLSQAYNGMILEIDADTLIDTSKGTPQLKGIGFKEAVASLYQAREKKEIPDNIHIRLININPALNKEEIIKVLGLTDDLLKSFVVIPNIPQDYIIKTLEPYLIEGSIRIIFEDNVRYWGKKVDVLVKRGEESKTLSSLGLIVAGLAKEPKFYEQLPKELKEYIVAKTDKEGKVELDDEGKIKQLIFKPIEKSKVDTQYLDRLDKANKELEGMV